MRIEIYADILCGWGYVASGQLRRTLGGTDSWTSVRWRPFLIDPAAPAPSESLEHVLKDGSVSAHLRACTPGLSADGARLRLADFATDAGIEAAWRHAWRASSWAAHRLVNSVGVLHGGNAQWDAVDELYQLHFDQGADINRLAVLRPFARRWQVPPPLRGAAEGFAPVFMEPLGDRRDACEHHTRDALWMGRGVGVASSPTVVVNGRLAMVGAQGPEALHQALRMSDEGRPTLPDEVRRLRAAQNLLTQDDPLACLAVLSVLHEEHPGDIAVDELRARAMARAAMLEPARRLLEDLVEIRPADAELRALLSQVLRRLGRPEEAPHQRILHAFGLGE